MDLKSAEHMDSNFLSVFEVNERQIFAQERGMFNANNVAFLQHLTIA